MFVWLDGDVVDVSRHATPIVKTGLGQCKKKTELEQLEVYYTALGVFEMTVRGRRCCVYRSAELCTLLHTTLNGTVATPHAMHKTITSEYMELVAMLEQIKLCKRRLSTMTIVLTRQAAHGRTLMQRIRPSSSNLCAFSFVDYISESYRKALERFSVYDELINLHLQDIQSIVEYMQQPLFSASTAAIMFDAIVHMLEACAHQRANISMRILMCKYQISPEVIASQLHICNDHMCTSIELCAVAHHKELVRCGACMSLCTSSCSSSCT